MHPYYLGLESELQAKYVKAHLYFQFPDALSVLTQEDTQRHRPLQLKQCQQSLAEISKHKHTAIVGK